MDNVQEPCSICQKSSEIVFMFVDDNIFTNKIQDIEWEVRPTPSGDCCRVCFHKTYKIINYLELTDRKKIKQNRQRIIEYIDSQIKLLNNITDNLL